jgi:anti-anti-sigma factor
MQGERRSSMSIRRRGSKVVVTLHGDLDSGATPMMGQFLVDLIDGQGDLDIVIDLRDVVSADKEILEVLAASGRGKRRRGRLYLAAPNQRVQAALRGVGRRTVPA